MNFEWSADIHDLYFSQKNYTHNVVEKLVPDPYLESQNWMYVWIKSLEIL